MLRDFEKLQNKSVDNIIEILKTQDEVFFKSPTGSGKTYMMADLMNKIIKENNDIVFIVSSLSKGDLAEQNYEKFLEYQNKFKYILPHMIKSESKEKSEGKNFIPTDSNVYVLPRDLFKKNSILNEGGLKAFLDETRKSKKIYVIKDECHLATNNLDELREEYFSKIINFSATPKLSKGQKPDIEIYPEDAEKFNLIKTVEYKDGNLVDCLNKFRTIKKAYQDSSIGVNPCLIIQISNEEKAENEISYIKECLSNNFDELKWMLIVNDEKKCETNDLLGRKTKQNKNKNIKKWKEYAKENHSTIDIIIFKMVITEGWDIPRACMLYQERDVKSSTLTEQVIGRVRRNPCLLSYEDLNINIQKLIKVAFVYNVEKPITMKVPVKLNNKTKIDECFKIQTTKLKKNSKKKIFNIPAFVSNQPQKPTTSSIFDLHNKYQKLEADIINECDLFSNTYSKWFSFMENSQAISDEIKSVAYSYSQNIELNDIQVSFPLYSFFMENPDTNTHLPINDWIWQREDGSNVFHFDSVAEKEWIEFLIRLIKKLSNERSVVKNYKFQDDLKEVEKFLVGKNFLNDSEISFEYYLNGIKKSYPDFLMKDYKDRVHIFESKSLNKSSFQNINESDYNEKIIALKEAYREISKIVPYNFYIPIKNKDEWQIFHYNNGLELIKSKDSLIDFISST